MGIGNSGTMRQPPRLGKLITPHGDREPASLSSPSQLSSFNSLPLMGIGNSSQTSSGMTTCSSLPLMGIGNPPPRLRGPWASPDSLPLMGIGNCARPGSSPAHSTSHYLSWGSGTTGAQLLLSTGELHSLPLMGIGNGCSQLRDPYSPRLITPHGDREHRWSARFSRGFISHYPSWGSGTRRTPASRRHPLPHYPSWGSGTCLSGPSYRSRPTSSLPLMGIGNSKNTILELIGENILITPHGDRERVASLAASLYSQRSSLPLMGIGNSGFLARRGRMAQVNSLPLMGIGNSASRPRPAVTRNSLSLMGIGNEPVAKVQVRGSRLITPHGDRERDLYTAHIATS